MHFYNQYNFVEQVVLSANKDLSEAAQNLFLSFRKLDSKGFDAILVENFPNEGLGKAINDRVQKAQYVNK